MGYVFEWPKEFQSPRKGGYRFEKPFITQKTRWGKLKYKAMYFSKMQGGCFHGEYALQKAGYLTTIERGNVLVPTYSSTTKKRGPLQKLTAWIVYARKFPKRAVKK